MLLPVIEGQTLNLLAWQKFALEPITPLSNDEVALCHAERRNRYSGFVELSMPRLARVVCPGVPHHITQRGIRRSNVFLEIEDYELYLKLLRFNSRHFGLDILAYCLMTNHVHVLGIPKHETSLARTFQGCHGLYAESFNKKYKCSGHLWQSRPYSCVMDEFHTWAAIRYIECNPVRAHMVSQAEAYRWSSAPAHCGLASDPLLLKNWPPIQFDMNWSEWLRQAPNLQQESWIRRRTFTGRPCGDSSFVSKIEQIVGRRLAPEKPGRKSVRKSETLSEVLGSVDEPE